MAVNIDELEVETQAPAVPQAGGAGHGNGQSNAVLKTELMESVTAVMERMRERELRLRAD